jgi:hypothetical protein
MSRRSNCNCRLPLLKLVPYVAECNYYGYRLHLTVYSCSPEGALKHWFDGRRLCCASVHLLIRPHGVVNYASGSGLTGSDAYPPL